MRTRMLAWAASCCLMLLSAPAASAGPSDPDPSFGGNGSATMPFGDPSNAAVTDVATAPDGKLVVSGREAIPGSIPVASKVALARFNPDGTPDTTFGGGDGRVALQLAGATSSSAEGVAVQPDGRIVIAGWAVRGGRNDLAVARFDSSGNLDPSYDGDGMKFNASGDSYKGFDVIIDRSGKAVVAAAFWQDVHGGVAGLHIIRFKADGSGDGSVGWLNVAAPSSDADFGAHAIVQAPDGSYYLAGTLPTFDDSGNALGGTQMVAVRSDPDIYADGTFGQRAGYAFSSHAADAHAYGTTIAVQDGKVLVGGYLDGTTEQMTFARFSTSGQPDAAFGPGGQRTFGLPGRDARVGDLLAQPDGKALAVGGASTENGAELTLTRLSTDGSLDRSWDGDGIAFGTIANGAPTSQKPNSDGLDEVAASWQGAKPVVGATALQRGFVFGLARFGRDDAPPPAGANPTPPAPGGSDGAAPSGPAIVDTTQTTVMPKIVGLHVDQAVDRLQRQLFANVDVSFTHNRGRARKPRMGEVLASTPRAGAAFTATAGGPRDVDLSVYAGPRPTGANRCPERVVKKFLKGDEQATAEALARALKCRVVINVQPTARAKEPLVAKVAAKNNTVTLTVKQPTKPERNALVLGFDGIPGVATFNARDWSLKQGTTNQIGVTVMSKNGDLIKNAHVRIDASDVGGRDFTRPSGEAGAGRVRAGVDARKSGKVTVQARAVVGGETLTGVGVINVKDQKSYVATTGDTITAGGSARPPKKSQVTSAAGNPLSDLLGQLLTLIGFGSPANQTIHAGGKPEEVISTVVKRQKVYPVQIAFGQPLGGGKPTPRVSLEPITVINKGKATTIYAPAVASGGGNVIAAGGGNAVAGGGGNAVASGGGNAVAGGGANAITREIDVNRAKLIGDHGSGLIGDHGSGLISDNGLGLLSDNGLGLLANPNSMIAISVSPAVAGGGGNLTTIGGVNAVAAGGLN